MGTIAFPPSSSQNSLPCPRAQQFNRRSQLVTRAAMFDTLSQSLNKAWGMVQKDARLTPDNMKAPLREIRRALLEADVSVTMLQAQALTVGHGFASCLAVLNPSQDSALLGAFNTTFWRIQPSQVPLMVVRPFIARVESRALGAAVTKGVSPQQQLVKVLSCVEDAMPAVCPIECRILVSAYRRSFADPSVPSGTHVSTPSCISDARSCMMSWCRSWVGSRSPSTFQKVAIHRWVGKVVRARAPMAGLCLGVLDRSLSSLKMCLQVCVHCDPATLLGLTS